MNTNDEKTFEQTAIDAKTSRLEDIRAYFYADPNWQLVDNGTLDTVLSYGPDSDDTMTVSADVVAEYRDESGALDVDGLVNDQRLEDDAREQMRERWYEYGLAFDYVAANTFEGQDQGYFRYQISWGGPSEEIRFYVDPGLNLYRAEFWYLDWFKGHRIPLHGDDMQLARDIFEEFRETGTVQHVLDEATA